MSMTSWSEYGLGFQLFTGDNTEKVMRFLKNHGEIISDWDSVLEEMRDDYFDPMDVVGEPASWAIARIINKQEGTTVFKGYNSCGDTDQEEMIGVEPCYPWGMNKMDRSLTKEKAIDILNKYAFELGSTSQPDYFEAKYFG